MLTSRFQLLHTDWSHLSQLASNLHLERGNKSPGRALATDPVVGGTCVEALTLALDHGLQLDMVGILWPLPPRFCLSSQTRLCRTENALSWQSPGDQWEVAWSFDLTTSQELLFGFLSELCHLILTATVWSVDTDWHLFQSRATFELLSLLLDSAMFHQLLSYLSLLEA